MPHLRLINALCALSLALSLNVHALSSDSQQPIDLAADSVDFDEGKGISTYKGNVDIRQGSMRLKADTVRIRQRGRKPVHITAIGSVRFSQNDDQGRPITALSKRAEYALDGDVLELIGNASLTQAGDTIRSDRIIYDRAQHQVRAGKAAKGEERVRITIQPSQ